jgi:hypothetical protein
MGQYYFPTCPDTSEFLHPHHFDDGLKLLEFGSGVDTVGGLAVLLAIPAEEERGAWTGGSPKLGGWAGKRLVIAGDYADKGRFVPPDFQDQTLFRYVETHGTNISADVMRALGDVAGANHPMARRLSLPEDASSFWHSAPEGMEDFLDLSKIADLQFESFKQIHLLGFRTVGLEGGDREVNFVRALDGISRKFEIRGPKVHSLEVNVSADGMRVESISFWISTETEEKVTWKFPLPAKTVYAALGII